MTYRGGWDRLPKAERVEQLAFAMMIEPVVDSYREAVPLFERAGMTYLAPDNNGLREWMDMTPEVRKMKLEAAKRAIENKRT